MPGMGGRKVYEELQRRDPEKIGKLFFSTGDMVSKDTRDFLKLTGVPCIQKPFQIDQLLETLLCFLEKSGGPAASSEHPEGAAAAP